MAMLWAGDTLVVYTGKVNERVTGQKDINKINWISERSLDKYEFSAVEKEVLLDFFKTGK